MKVTIHDFEESEPYALKVALERIFDRWGEMDAVDVYCNKRESNGWLEYGLNIFKDEKRVIYIAMIQRAESDRFEFHS